MAWAPPGKEAHPNRWRYDLRKGFVPPGHSTDPAGTQYEMPQGFDPAGAPKGFHVVESPPGTAAPIGAINYTPDTREVHDVGTLAPVDKRNLSLIPDSGLHKLAYSRRAQRQASMGAGQDQAQPFPGTPPISSNFPRPMVQTPQPVPQMPTSGMSPTSSPPGSPYGRQPLGIGAGQDAADPTDPTAGADATAPSADETSGAPDPNWANVGPEYTGHRRVDSTHVAEMVNGKPIGFWIKKPGATDLDPSAWSFRAEPRAAAGGVTYTSEQQPDGSILLRGSNGDVRRVAAPRAPAADTRVSFGTPHRDESGNLVQTGSNGEVRVIERAPTPKTPPKPTTTWGQPYQAPDGSYVQQSSTGEIRAVPGTRLTTATEKWGPPESKPDGSIWQQNTTTGKWEIIQSPDTKLTDPFTVGNRLVKFDPESNTYKEVFRAPQNMSLQTLANGSIVGVNQETGETTPILDDPTAASTADLRQRQAELGLRQGEQTLRQGEQTLAQDKLKGEQALRQGEVSMQATEMGMIPQPYVSGGNLIVPEGAEADVTDWNPLTGQSSQRVAGHHRTIPEVLQRYGFNQGPAQPQTYTPPTAPAGAGVPAPPPQAEPVPAPGNAMPGTLAPAGVAGTPADPTVQADYTGNVPPPPDTGPRGGTDWLFSSPASPVDNPANTPQAAPAEEPAPEEPPAEEPPPDDAPTDDAPEDDMGAGADRKGTSDSQGDLMIDIPRFAHKKKWKGIGSKFLGRGLDDFQPFVGVGQDSGVLGAAGQPPPSAPPPVGPGGAAIPPPPAGGGLGGPPKPGMSGKAPGKWDPQQLQQLLPLLLMLLSGGSGGGAQGGSTPPRPAPPAPAATPPTPTPPMPGGAASGMGGGMGMGQDQPQGFQPPIDPQHVVGTGHKFGQAMNAGDPVHRGVDLQAPKGTPVKAPVDGVVKINHNPQGLGLEAVVVSPDGKEHKLGHLASVAVKPGQQVRAGQVIGQVGDSGLTTGANLHYAEKKGTHYFNPSGKMGVMADLPPAPGTQMMSAGATPEAGAGQDQTPEGAGEFGAFPNLRERFRAGRLASRPDAGVDPYHPFGSYEESETLPSEWDVQEYQSASSTPAYVPREPSQPSMSMSGPVGEDTPLYPWTRPDRARTPQIPQGDSPWPNAEPYVPPIPVYDDSQPFVPATAPLFRPQVREAVVGSGQDSIDPGGSFSSGAWSSGPGGQIQTRTQQLINSGVDPATAYSQASSAVAAGGRGYTGPSHDSGGGGGGGQGEGTNVSIDPATRARLQLDTQVAEWTHDQQTTQLQQSAKAEDDRHAEELTRLQQSAAQEADWRAVQDAVNQENARHNQAQEQLAQQQQALDRELEQSRERSAMALQQESEGFQAGQTARQNALGILQSSLNNPWIQALTKLGITPGGGGTSGANPLMGLLNQILGGANSGNLQQAGVPGGGQLPNVSPQEFQAMSVPQKAALRAQIEAMGPGMWEQFQSNFQNQAGTNQAPDQTQMQQAIWTPEDALGSQMSSEMFGEGQPAFQQRQQRNWAPAQGTNVMQSLLSGTGFG